MSQSEPLFEINPIGGRLGAEIRGVRLSSDLPQAVITAIQAAVHQYKVVFFRDQQHLDDAAQEAFATRFGAPVAHPTVPVAEGSSYLLELNSERGGRATARPTARPRARDRRTASSGLTASLRTGFPRAPRATPASASMRARW